MDNNDNSQYDDDDNDKNDLFDDQSQRPVLVVGASGTQLESFHEDVQYLWAPFDSTTIPIYDEPPSSLNFLRNHVSVSRPCIIRNSILVHNDDTDNDNHGSNRSSNVVVPLQLTLDDLVQRFPDSNNNDDDDGNDEDNKEYPSSSRSSLPPSLPPLTVDLTPDGHGDCLRKVAIACVVTGHDNDAADVNDELCMKKEVIKKVFVKPLEQEMSLSSFRRHLRKGRHKQKEQQQQKQQQEGGGRRRKNKSSVFNRIFLEEEELKKITTARTGDEDKDDNDPEYIDNTDTDFLDDCVMYYSRQNDCLREELSPLWNAKVKSLSTSSSSSDGNDSSCCHDYLFPRSFPWAEEAFFGQQPQQQTDTTTAARSSSTPTNTTTIRGPDACNIWIGDERAVSSMHKDYYENLFYVASGEKVFQLCPPSDIPFLYEQEVISGRFQHQQGQVDDGQDRENSHDDNDDGTPRLERTRRWTVVLDRDEEEEDQDEGIVGTSTTTSSNYEHENEATKSTYKNKKYSKVHWIAADPFAFRNDEDADVHDDDTKGEEEDQERTKVNESSLYPLSKYAHPITVKVKAGELLYLPSLWFHRVTQTCETIGINYWYDMNFESPLYCYFHFLQQLRKTTSQTTSDT